MKNLRILSDFKLFGQKLKKNVNQSFLTYVIFILIAVLIWYLNALNKDYTTELKFAVRYTDLPDDKALVNSSTDHLMLTINAQGFTLLKYKYGFIFSPIVMEASYNTLRKRTNSLQGEYFIATNNASCS